MTDHDQDKRPDRRALSSAARMYAVQALFQMEAAGQSADRVALRIPELPHRFLRPRRPDRSGRRGAVHPHRRRRRHRGSPRSTKATDRGLVAAITHRPDRSGAARRVPAPLAPNWWPNVHPPKVVITEYVRLTQAFFPDGREARFVNAVLDRMARDFDPDSWLTDGFRHDDTQPGSLIRAVSMDGRVHSLDPDALHVVSF